VAAMRYAALHLLLSSATVVAQMYQFEDTAVPKNRSMHTLYAFYIFSEQDAPDKSLGKPFVEFNGLQCHSTSATRTDASLSDYQSVQVSIVKFRQFWKVINPKKFCASWDDVESKRAPVKDQLLLQVQGRATQTESFQGFYTHTIRFPNVSHPTRNERRIVERTGVYILVFSNCGNFREATVEGSVVVKNAYGFLPGNEYYKMPFYGWLLLVYVGIAVIWMVLSIRRWRELFNIQHCIATVIILGALEAFMWYVFYNDWNGQGVRGKTMFVLATLLTVVKSTFSYMLVLVASLGWGITRPFLDRSVVRKIQGLCFFYIVLVFIRETVLSFRNSHSLSMAFVLLCLLPVSVLNGVIFYWVFTALSSLIESLKERGQTEKLILFERLWKFLIWTLAAAMFTLLFQIFNLTKSITERWKYQWLFSDAVSHTLFLLVLSAMMYLWAPSKHSQRYAYSTQLDDCESPKAQPGSMDNCTATDEVGVRDDDDDSFWAATGGGTEVVPADVVGAPGPDQDRSF